MFVSQVILLLLLAILDLSSESSPAALGEMGLAACQRCPALHECKAKPCGAFVAKMASE